MEDILKPSPPMTLHEKKIALIGMTRLRRVSAEHTLSRRLQAAI
jgi:hypothetical protein